MDIMTLALALAGLAIGFLIGMLRSRQAAATFQRDLALAVKREDYEALQKENAGLTAQLAGTNDRMDEKTDELEQAKRELTAVRERAITAESTQKALDTRLKEQAAELEKMQEKLRLEFKNTANTLFEDMSKKFSTHSEKQIGDLLNPLRERLGEFQKTVVESFTAQGKEQHTLKAEIDKIVLQTDSLTKALRGDVKAQGNWGEVMLERILEASGLEKGIGYILQGTGMGLTSADGKRQQPDVIIMLPDEKHIIIDAKVSLVAYERYCGEKDDTAKVVHLNQYLQSIRAHIDGLEQRRYQDNEKLHTPDFVFMFMPVEGAFSFAMQADNDLQPYAWSKRIVLVPPSMLLANLRTIASIWRIERQNRYAQEIARQGGALYDKFAGFVEDMQKIGVQITGVQKTYDGAMNKLSEGRGNLIGSVEKLKTLGAKAAKSLPKELLGDDDSDVPQLTVDA